MILQHVLLAQAHVMGNADCIVRTAEGSRPSMLVQQCLTMQMHHECPDTSCAVQLYHSAGLKPSNSTLKDKLVLHAYLKGKDSPIMKKRQ